MEIYPRDLGTRRYLTLLKRRASVGAGGRNSSGTVTAASANSAALSADDVKPSRSRYVKAWTRNLKVKDPEVRAKAATLALNGSAGVGIALGMILGSIYLMLPLLIVAATTGHIILPILVAGGWIAAMLSLWNVTPRKALEKMDGTPLTASEVEALMLTARGRLDRAYLNLVLDAVRETGVGAESTREDIRGALMALGETIDKLPAEPVRAQDPETLRNAAEARRMEAGRETDAAAKASLVRQAEALERRAMLGESGSAAARRARALRQEVMVQMDSLRAVLLAFDQVNGGPLARATATGLSETVGRVSAEAEAMAQAHRELQDQEIASLLGSALPAPQAGTISSPTPVSPSRSVPASQQQPQQTVGNGTSPSRKWWRSP